MDINAKDVMRLREKTGAGMMDCKEALKASNGDVEAAVEYLRKKGIAKARSKAERVAKEGLVASYISEDGHKGSLVEINCETDFVAKTPDFQGFIVDLAQQLVGSNQEGILERDTLSAFKLANGKSVQDRITELVAKLGENITASRAVVFFANDGFLTNYIHLGGKLGVLVELITEGKSIKDIQNFAKDVSMQIAAAKPLVVNRSEVPQDWVEKEKEIYREQALNEGKPVQIVDKIAEGKLKKYFSEVCLLEQPFVKNDKVSIQEECDRVVKTTSHPITVRRFARLQVGQVN
jgi:elongation factor Ts